MNDKSLKSTPDEIWNGTLLDRRREAELLIGYVESIASRHVDREDSRGYTIAVDAGYGEGKTYFLKRLAKHFAMNHPVAFIDAWRDDLSDEPLIALASTLEDALGPFQNTPEIKKKWKVAKEKAGKIAKIAAKGLAQKGLSLIITEAAAMTVASLATEETKPADDKRANNLKGVGDETSRSAINSIFSEKSISKRISEFRESQKAIEELKKSLKEIINVLTSSGTYPPIVIIVDELDRCRPTYAIKLLEEIKHFFDVEGLVFIFGLHTDQLVRSVSGCYGAHFDGRSYIRRFINRRYTLKTPDLEPLVEHVLLQFGVDQDRFVFPRIYKEERYFENKPALMISLYARAFGLGVRDVFQLVDQLQTCCALTGSAKLMMPYLLPLLIKHIRQEDGENFECYNKPNIVFALHAWSGEFRQIGIMELFSDLKTIATSNAEYRTSRMRNESDPVSAFYAAFQSPSSPSRVSMADPSNYSELIRMVSRFVTSASGTKDGAAAS